MPCVVTVVLPTPTRASLSAALLLTAYALQQRLRPFLVSSTLSEGLSLTLDDLEARLKQKARPGSRQRATSIHCPNPGSALADSSSVEGSHVSLGTSARVAARKSRASTVVIQGAASQVNPASACPEAPNSGHGMALARPGGVMARPATSLAAAGVRSALRMLSVRLDYNTLVMCCHILDLLL